MSEKMTYYYFQGLSISEYSFRRVKGHFLKAYSINPSKAASILYLYDRMNYDDSECIKRLRELYE